MLLKASAIANARAKGAPSEGTRKTMSWAKIAVLIAAVALGGFLFRYGSVDPCEWLRYDMTAKNGLPRIMVDAAVRIKRKVVMTAGNCCGEWLRFHKDGV